MNLMNEIKVSVIIPVYNSDKYLYQCVEGVIKQTYTNLEIIIVDDGSIDRSRDICKKLQQLDSRVKVFYNENHGVGYTRNYGIQKASGDCIVFIDSDDCCQPQMINTLVDQLLATEADLIVSGVNLFRERVDNVLRTENVEKGIKDKYSYIKDVLLKVSIGYVCGAPYAKLYKKTIIDNYRIRFDEKLKYGEDFCFNMEYLKYVKKVSLIEDAYYLYRMDTPNSLTYYNKTDLDVKSFWEQRKIVYMTYESVFEEFKNDRYVMSIVNSLLMDYVISTIKLASKDIKKNRVLLYSLIDNSFVNNRVSYANASISKKTRVFMISNKMFLPLLIIEKIRYFFIRLISYKIDW